MLPSAAIGATVRVRRCYLPESACYRRCYLPESACYRRCCRRWSARSRRTFVGRDDGAAGGGAGSADGGARSWLVAGHARGRSGEALLQVTTSWALTLEGPQSGIHELNFFYKPQGHTRHMGIGASRNQPRSFDSVNSKIFPLTFHHSRQIW